MSNSLFDMIFFNISLIGLTVSIIINICNISLFFFILLISINIVDFFMNIKDKLNFGLIVLMIIGINSVLFFFYIYDFLTSNILLLLLFTNFIISELIMSLIWKYDIKQSKIEIILEIDGFHIRKFENQILKKDFTIDQIRSISFTHEIILGLYGGYWWYKINFEFVNNKNIEFIYSRKTIQMLRFLLFLENYCSTYNINFQKIAICGNNKRYLGDLKEYLKIDKLKTMLGVIFGVSFGLLISSLVLLPIIIALIEKELFIISNILIFLFLIIPIILMIVSGIYYKKQ